MNPPIHKRNAVGLKTGPKHPIAGITAESAGEGMAPLSLPAPVKYRQQIAESLDRCLGWLLELGTIDIDTTQGLQEATAKAAA